MAVIPGLLKIHVLHIFYHTLRQYEQGGKHHGRKYDGKDSHQIPIPVSPKAPAA